MGQNVIDSLIVTLGLDASQFTREQKRAAAQLVKTKNEMKATAGEMAGAFRRVGLEFAGIFFGIRGTGDIIHKFAELNSVMADLGYTSRQLGESAANLRLYQQIAGGFGGTAGGVNQMVAGLEQGMFQLRYMGQMSGQMLAWLRFGGGLPPTNAQGGIDVLKMVDQLRGRLHGMNDVDKNQILLALGVSGGIRNAILSTREKYEQWLKTQKESAKQMAAGTNAAQDLQRSWRNLQYSVDGAAATILTSLTPALRSMLGNLAKIAPTELENLTKWIKTHGPEVTTFFSELNSTVGALAKAMQIIGAVGHWLFGVPGKAIGNAAGWLMTPGNKQSNVLAIRRAQMAGYVSGASKAYGIPAGMLDALLTQESGYNPKAISKKGALGIAQFMPGTAAQYGVDPFDPKSAIYGAGRYLSDLHRRFGSWQAALAAYNEGPGAYAAGHRYPEARAYAASIMAHSSASAMHHTTNVQTGNITINTRATDAAGIAGSVKGEIQRKFNVFQTPNGAN